MEKGSNHLKVVLAEKKKTSKWLAEQLGCAPTTVSKWCTNASQPPMETYLKIANVLEVELDELFNKRYVKEVLANSKCDTKRKFDILRTGCCNLVSVSIYC